MRRVQKHEVRSRATDLRARHHETEVFRFDVLTASLQTMRHGRSETRLVAAQAFINAGLHVFAHMFHRLLQNAVSKPAGYHLTAEGCLGSTVLSISIKFEGMFLRQNPNPGFSL
jgi:hypothetical protein